jgi:protein-disulfide isomerase
LRMALFLAMLFHIEDAMKILSRSLIATTLVAATTLLPARAEDFSDGQKQIIENIIRDYLLKNPELLREMADKLEEKQRVAEEEQRGVALQAQKDEIFRAKGDAVVGDAKGDVTIVEFMDYNCGWCKKAMLEIGEIVKADPKVKVVFKEFPIFGEHSEYAARAALAAEKQGKYWQLHQAMFAHEGQVTIDVVDQLAAANGLDVAKMKTDIESAEIAAKISANLQLGKELAINGTPAFIIDDQVVGGYMQLDAMRAAIKEVRETGGCKIC